MFVWLTLTPHTTAFPKCPHFNSLTKTTHTHTQHILINRCIVISASTWSIKSSVVIKNTPRLWIRLRSPACVLTVQICAAHAVMRRTDILSSWHHHHCDIITTTAMATHHQQLHRTANDVHLHQQHLSSLWTFIQHQEQSGRVSVSSESHKHIRMLHVQTEVKQNVPAEKVRLSENVFAPTAVHSKPRADVQHLTEGAIHDCISCTL